MMFLAKRCALLLLVSNYNHVSNATKRPCEKIYSCGSCMPEVGRKYFVK